MDPFLEILNSFLGAEYAHRPLIGTSHIPYVLPLPQAKRETAPVLFLTQGFPHSLYGHKEWNMLLPIFWSSHRALMDVVQVNFRSWKSGSALNFLFKIKHCHFDTMPFECHKYLCSGIWKGREAPTLDGRGMRHLIIVIFSLFVWFCIFSIFHYCSREQMGVRSYCNTQQDCVSNFQCKCLC